jgi:Protein of unknown function (DUF3710)
VVFRRFQREQQQADWLGRSYGTAEEEPDRHGYPGEPDDNDELDEDEDEDEDDYGPEPDGSGPWDGAQRYPRGNRVDFGSLLVPQREGLEIRINLTEAVMGVSVDIVSQDMLHGGSYLQLQAFAAPKSSGLWDEVREEIAAEVAKSGGRSQEAPGPYGTELHAMVSTGAPGGRRQLEPHRFLGVDGPRWFLRGVIRGPAASHPALARPLEEAFGDVVVVRGEHAVAPRELLALQLPEDTRRALAEQLGQELPASPAPGDEGPPGTRTR